jgi:hypothetical protein
VILLNNKTAANRKDRLEQQAELKSKVNKLFDLRASDPLIINRLKRNDSVLNNVKVNENYFHHHHGRTEVNPHIE